MSEGGPAAVPPVEPTSAELQPSARAQRLLRRGRAIGRWKRIGYTVAGVTCLVVGVIGGFVPVLQGWMFIGLGIAFLAPVFPPARRLMVWAFRRWPRLRRAVPRRVRRRAWLVEKDVDVPIGSASDRDGAVR